MVTFSYRTQSKNSNIVSEYEWEVSILIDNWPFSIDTYRYFIISILPITSFNRFGAKAHTSDLTLDLVGTHFKKRVISNHFPLKKMGAGAGHHTARSQFFGPFPLGLCRGPVLRKQTDNFGSAKKYHPYFRLVSRGSGHFLVGYLELPEAFGASCGDGRWTHRKCYNLSYLTRVLPFILRFLRIFFVVFILKDPVHSVQRFWHSRWMFWSM